MTGARRGRRRSPATTGLIRRSVQDDKALRELSEGSDDELDPP